MSARSLTDEVEATGGDLEETLVNFLSELLYRFEGERRVYREFEILELSDEHVSAVVQGRASSTAARHTRRKGIKAVTFHDVEIKRGAERADGCDDF